MLKKKKIAFVLGAGGARGFSHIGVLKTLKKQKIEADMIVGASMGAVIGACYALGLDMDEIEKVALGMNKGKAVTELFEVGKFNKSMIGSKKVYNFLKKYLKDALFIDTKIPLRIVATNFNTGEEVIFKSGKIIDAVMASICVPGIFFPVKIGAQYYIDGGVTNPTPVDVAIDMGADFVIGVDLFVQEEVHIEKLNLITTLLQTYNIIRMQAVNFKTKELSDKVILIKPKMRESIDSFKFYDIDKFINSGVEATKDVLDEIEKRLKLKK